ncbi:MAG: DUF2165 domain-containing protein [Pseudomonadota bacterium]
MFAIRLSKVVMTGGLSIWGLLVVLGNTTDYGTNWAFVQHVLAMDTIFPDSTLKWRAITDPEYQRTAYLIIIVTEGLTALAFLIASVAMAARLRAPTEQFRRARALTAWGVLLGFGLYFIGFMAIGAEWFAMWQSKTWNGQQAAFMFVAVILAVGIYVLLDNDGSSD